MPCTRLLTRAEIGGAYEHETGAGGGRDAEDPGILRPCRCPPLWYTGTAPFTWGATAGAAVHNAVVLEEVARIAILSRMVADPKPISQDLLDRHFKRKHGPGAYYGQGTDH